MESGSPGVNRKCSQPGVFSRDGLGVPMLHGLGRGVGRVSHGDKITAKSR